MCAKCTMCSTGPWGAAAVAQQAKLSCTLLPLRTAQKRSLTVYALGDNVYQGLRGVLAPIDEHLQGTASERPHR